MLVFAAGTSPGLQSACCHLPWAHVFTLVIIPTETPDNCRGVISY